MRLLDHSKKNVMNNNSTLPSPTEVAMALNVKPTKLDASVNEWKRAYKTHRKVLPCKFMLFIVFNTRVELTYLNLNL